MKFSDYIKKSQHEDHNPYSIIINDKIRIKEYCDERLGKNELFNHRLYAGYDINECLKAIEKPCVVRLNNGWHVMKILLGCDDIITAAELTEWQGRERTTGEWAPKQVKPGFTVERILPMKHYLYKLFVFHGKVHYIWHQVYTIEGAKIGKLLSATMYDTGWKKINVQWNKNPFPDAPVPGRLLEMIHIAEKLAWYEPDKAWTFCRVDLYCNDNRIRLSEMMNLHAGGTNGFSGDFDYVLGALI